jgi:hypothetical protein
MTREPLTTIKVSPSAHRLLRLIAAAGGQHLYEAVDRVAEAEAERLSLRRAGPVRQAKAKP